MPVAEKEEEYGVPYGADAVNVDMKYINSDEYAKKFENITDNPRVNQTLLECSRAAIQHRNGTLYEDMYLINGNTGEIMGEQTDCNIKRGIVYNNSINSAIAKARFENIPLIAFHTHPEGYPPSVDDFNSAYKHNYFLSVIAGHNGQVYTYNNNVGIIEDRDIVQSNIGFAYGMGYDVDRAFKETYNEIGLDYTIIKE